MRASQGAIMRSQEKEGKFVPMDKFWMLYVEGGQSPTHKHFDKNAAKIEAERLARISNERVHVLESVASVKKNDLEWEGSPSRSPESDDIPF